MIFETIFFPIKKLGRTLFIVFVWALTITSHAQQQRIDSLQSLLPGKPDSMRTKILYELAYEYVDFNDSLGAMYGALAFECARQIGDSLGMVKAARIRATAFRRLEELDSAIAQALAVLPIARRNDCSKEVTQLLRGVALAYTFKATYDSGLYYNLELLRVTEQTHDTIERSFAFTNIGVIHYKLANFENALHHYYQALALADRGLPVNRFHIANTFLNMSLCYSYRNDFPKAREFLKKGIDYYGPGTLAALDMQSLQVAGFFYYRSGDLDSAEVFYLRSYFMARKLNSKRFQLIVLSGLVDTYLTKGELPLATRYLSEAESIMQRMAFKVELTTMYLSLRSFCRRTGDIKGLMFYQRKYIQVNDSIHSQASKNNLMKIESEYLERTNKARITQQEQLLALQDKVIERQNAFNILVMIILVLLVLFLYLLYRGNAEKKLAGQLLEQRVRERTEALEHSHRLLQQAFTSKNVGIAKTFRMVRQHMATLRGLCSMALRDGDRLQGKNRLQQLAVVTSDVVLTLDKISDTKVEYDL